MAATTSTNCSSFFNLRSNSVETRVRISTSHGSSPGCGKPDGVAMWFINGVASAFFASLERCSCIRIATEDDGDGANDAPLILNDGNTRYHGDLLGPGLDEEAASAVKIAPGLDEEAVASAVKVASDVKVAAAASALSLP
ncbi:hypothetical protein DKX38_002643 [Salix brachista]|uniref:Uncharacterized protein n=1 Tax=Salix brachista TaxID=2182728 RepID=A0A5N5NMM5_9ROSI|nr:hypothetical protein DKX38_002643 [Salix brachista]